MADLTLTIPDSLLDDLLEAFAVVFPIPVDEEGNPTYTRKEWAKHRLRLWVRWVYRTWKADEAARTAGDAAGDQADQDSDGIEVTG